MQISSTGSAHIEKLWRKKREKNFVVWPTRKRNQSLIDVDKRKMTNDVFFHRQMM